MNNSSCNKDCQTRIGKATSVFGRLKPVWKNKHISLAFKVRLYESLVMKTTLYSAELWPLSVTRKKVGSGTPEVPTTDTGHLMVRQSKK